MRLGLTLSFLLVLCLAGCDPQERNTSAAAPGTPMAPPPVPPAPAPGALPLDEKKAEPADSKKAALNKKNTLFLETFPDGRRRVLIEAAVCLREGPLELLLCRKETKEHEAILHADVNAQDIHVALIAAKAKPGAPVKYTETKIIPPTGAVIRVALQFEKEPGKVVTVNAREWIQHAVTKKPLDRDWVFAGSAFWRDEEMPDKPPYYLANNGNVISIANFNDAMLDLPIASSKENAELAFQCWTERIPEVGTKVTVILEPVIDDKKDEK
jgi:hypothetical protein